MFSLICWKIGFEVANIRRALETRESAPKENYFAFGGNLSPDVLKLRRMYPIWRKDLVLRGYKMKFTQPGPYQGMGFANIEPDKEGVCYGRIYTISKMDAKRMDYFEAVPFLKKYRRVYIEQDGVNFFYYESTAPQNGLRPSKQYLGYIIHGLELSAPAEYLACLKEAETLAELIPYKDRAIFMSLPHWAPSVCHRCLPFFDRITILLYMKVLRHLSFTEWMIGKLKNS